MLIFAAATLALQLTSSSLVAAVSCDEPNQGATVVTATEPKFSKAQLKQSHANRTALVLVRVAPSGSVQTVSIQQSSGDATVDKAAMEAARTSTYSPATHDCAPVAGKYLFAVNVKADH
jgi:TonB family protein